MAQLLGRPVLLLIQAAGPRLDSAAHSEPSACSPILLFIRATNPRPDSATYTDCPPRSIRAERAFERQTHLKGQPSEGKFRLPDFLPGAAPAFLFLFSFPVYPFLPSAAPQSPSADVFFCFSYFFISPAAGNPYAAPAESTACLMASAITCAASVPTIS